jgi:class 3 adenylate cyclase
MELLNQLTELDIKRVEEYRKGKATAVLAILFTDIVGYTKFTYDAGEENSARLRHIHDEIIQSHITKSGFGEIIKQIGDSFLIVFSDPTIAVQQALELQRSLKVNEKSLTHDGYTLKVRMGLHLGQVSIENNIAPDIFGTHVNIAARVMSIAKGGQLIVSRSIWENASGWLKNNQNTDIKYDYLGKVQLKGIEKKIEIFEFYFHDLSSKGIPDLLKKQKLKKITQLLAFSALVLALMISGVYLIVNKLIKPLDESQPSRKVILLSNVDSYYEDTTFVINFSAVVEFPELKQAFEDQGKLRLINTDQLDQITKDYQNYFLNAFITEYDILLEDQLKATYAKSGKTLPGNLRNLDDNSFRDLVVIPHLYKFETSSEYFLFIEWNGFTGNLFVAKILTNTEEVPSYITSMSADLIDADKRSRFFQGKVARIEGNDVIIHFRENMIKPQPHVFLSANRIYQGFSKLTDSGVLSFIRDMENGIEYYKSEEAFKDKLEAENSLFLFEKYEQLKAGYLKTSSGGFITRFGVSLKVTEVYDTTLLATILEQKYPWMRLKEGDLVELKSK